MEKLSRLPSDKIDIKKMQTMWEKLDLEIGGIFQKWEKSLNLPTKTREWSPALAKLGAECPYWKA